MDLTLADLLTIENALTERIEALRGRARRATDPVTQRTFHGAAGETHELLSRVAATINDRVRAEHAAAHERRAFATVHDGHDV